MGLKDFFSNYRENQDRRRLEKLTKRLCEKFAQDYERYAAADELDKMDGDDAVFALLQRFGILTPKIIDDEQEKKYVYKLVQAKGEGAVPAILKYVREKEGLVYPLRLLKEIVGPDRARELLLEVMREFSPEYDRTPERKIDVIQALGEFEGAEMIPVLLPFLKDPDDDVVTSAMDVLSKHQDDEGESIRNAFLETFLDPEEKPRVKRRVLELLKELRWKVTGHRKQVEERLPEEYYLDKKGFLKRKGEA